MFGQNFAEQFLSAREVEKVGKEFTALPFGPCTAPYIFTKILKPVMQNLIEKGIVLVVYLDDILIIARSEYECKNNVNITKRLLGKLGFVINTEKVP